MRKHSKGSYVEGLVFGGESSLSLQFGATGLPKTAFFALLSADQNEFFQTRPHSGPSRGWLHHGV
ncbi:MAG: hypothetical protein EBR81_05260 [Proteobacteria bacterium]|nr:hypothetical protein [Pseudomonadota bacterium]